MASGIAYVAEFVDCGFIGRNGKIDALIFPAPTTVQLVTTSSGLAAAQSSAFASSTNAVRVHTDGGNPICIAFGTNPTASSSNSMRINSNSTEYFSIPTGGGQKLSAVFVT